MNGERTETGSLDGFVGDETSLSVIFRRILHHSGYRGKPKTRRSDSQDRPDGRRLTLIPLAQAHGPLLKGGAVCYYQSDGEISKP